MSSSGHPDQKYPPIAWMIIVGAGVVSFAMAACMPFFAIFLSRVFGMSPTHIGIVLAMWPAGTLTGSFFSGYLADRYGRRKLVVVALALLSLAYLGMGIVALTGPSQAAIVAFGVLEWVAGIATTFYFSSSQALMADLLPSATLHDAIRVRYASLNVGSALGPLVGAWSGLAGGAHAFWLNGGVPLLFAGAMAALMRSQRDRVHAETKTQATFLQAMGVLKRDVGFRYAVAGSALFSGVYFQFDSTAAQYVAASFEDGVRVFSYLVSLNGVAVVLFQIGLNKQLKAWAPVPTLVWGCVIVAAGCAAYGLADSRTWVFVVATVLVSLGEVMVFPTTTIMVDKLARVDLKATYYAAANLRWAGNVAGMLVGGWVLERLGGRSLFLGVGVLALLVIWFFVRAGRRVSG